VEELYIPTIGTWCSQNLVKSRTLMSVHFAERRHGYSGYPPKSVQSRRCRRPAFAASTLAVPVPMPIFGFMSILVAFVTFV
jgi:hypothetical protein